MRLLSVLVLICMLMFASNCGEEPDCNQFPPTADTYMPFMFVDSITNENLVQEWPFNNPKRISLDSLALFNTNLDKLPQFQWMVENSAYGYTFFIYVFDRSKVPNVDTETPGSVTYYIYSGDSQYDTIVYKYHFQRKEHCYSITNDTLNCFVNGKPGEFATKGPVRDVFIIKK